MPRKPIGEMAMTDAERQARYRAARATGKPAIRTRRPADHRSRTRRWHDAVAELVELQAQYATWLITMRLNHRAVTGSTSVQMELHGWRYCPLSEGVADLRVARVSGMYQGPAVYCQFSHRHECLHRQAAAEEVSG